MHIQVLPDIELRMQRKTSLNRLCDISEWEVRGTLSKIMAELGEGAYIHRKSWEYALCIYGLRRLEAIRPEARAMATGAGYERPLFYKHSPCIRCALRRWGGKWSNLSFVDRRP